MSSLPARKAPERLQSPLSSTNRANVKQAQKETRDKNFQIKGWVAGDKPCNYKPFHFIVLSREHYQISVLGGFKTTKASILINKKNFDGPGMEQAAA